MKYRLQAVVVILTLIAASAPAADPSVVNKEPAEIRAKQMLAPAAAAQSLYTRAPVGNRFTLFNACRPVPLKLTPLPQDAGAPGVTAEAVRAAAAGRLRKAGIYEPDVTKTGPAYLLIDIKLSGRFYVVGIEYHKPLRDEYGHQGVAGTWSSLTVGAIGVGPGPSKPLELIGWLLDGFVREYLQANQTACAQD
ncbi:MAG: hypothetical protein OXL36_13305 [Bryobacterales bacterium]|nr:hypothetical protein [Bryobacterales bacterium]MDE0294529.1 hypothetical protein [Bryobacterales bacterium]